jgi:hypothetical protein
VAFRKEASALGFPSIAASTLVVAACALPFAPTAHGDVRTVPVPRTTCNLPTARSLIIWQHAPGRDDRSLFVNESDLANCRPVLETWRAGQTAAPGYCSKIAWSTDNPGYIPGVLPATPLKKVIDQVGDCNNATDGL